MLSLVVDCDQWQVIIKMFTIVMFGLLCLFIVEISIGVLSAAAEQSVRVILKQSILLQLL